MLLEVAFWWCDPAAAFLLWNTIYIQQEGGDCRGVGLGLAWPGRVRKWFRECRTPLHSRVSIKLSSPLPACIILLHFSGLNRSWLNEEGRESWEGMKDREGDLTTAWNNGTALRIMWWLVVLATSIVTTLSIYLVILFYNVKAFKVL